MLRNLPLSLGVITVFGLLVLMNRPSLVGATDYDSPLPHWIWTTVEKMPSNEKDSDKTSVMFQRSFAVTLPVRTAIIQLAADFCHATVIVNERRLFKVEPYSQTIELDITSAMMLGENTLRIEATPSAGPSAIAASLALGIADESRIQTLVSDASWTYATLSNLAAGESKMKPIVSLGTVTPELWEIGRRSSKVEPTENYEQWRQAVARKSAEENRFWTAPGFEISLVRAATSEEGSWVSMAFDPQGRLTIAREEKGLLRMKLDNQSHSIEKVEMINDQLLECRGLLYAHNALYANANNSKGLYRLRDTDGDDRSG